MSARKGDSAPTPGKSRRPPRSGARTAILILGVHRSGTSALTRVLGLCGAALPRRPLPPAPDNPTGFWESDAIHRIHTELLDELGSSWHDISPLPESRLASPAASRAKLRLVDALREDFGDASLFVVKDPRICRLVPLWKEVTAAVGAEPRAVIPVRNPLEVASSLARRNGFPQEKSFLIWLHHFLFAERSTRDLPRSFTAFSGLLSDWRRVVRRIERDLHLELPAFDEKAHAEAGRFLDRGLHHEISQDEEILASGDVSGWLQVAYKWARTAATRRPPSTLQLDRLVLEMSAADATYGRLFSEAERERAEATSALRGEIASVRALTADGAQRAAEQLARYEEQASRLQEVATRIAPLEAQIERSLARTEALETATQVRLAAHTEQHSALIRELAALTEELRARVETSSERTTALETAIEVRLAAQAEEQAGRVRELVTFSEGLQARLETSLERIEALETRVTTRSEEHAARHETLAALTEGLQARVEALRREMDVLDGTMQRRLTAVRSSSEAEAAELREGLERLDGRHDTARSMTESIELRVAEHLGRITRLEAQIERLKRLSGWSLLTRMRRRLTGRSGVADTGEPAPSPDDVYAEPGEILAICDRPPLGNEPELGTSVTVEGWALARQGVLHVEVLIDGQSLGKAEYGLSRPDVGAGHRNMAGAGRSGFRGSFDLGAFSPGKHLLTLRVVDKGSKVLLLEGPFILEPSLPMDEFQQYEAWVERNRLVGDRLRAAEELAADLEYKPTISVIMPVYNSVESHLREAIESVKAQIYDRWELCIADDASTQPEIVRVIEGYATEDERIKFVVLERNRGIGGASNAALELATGEFIALLDHDDVLSRDALLQNALLLDEHRDADMIYSDEDKISDDGKVRYEPFFKPDWSPDLFLSMMYTCHLGVYRASKVRQVGGFRDDYAGSQDYDLVLRLTEVTDRIFHIPRVLYSWRAAPGSAATDVDAKGYANTAARRALESALSRRNVDAVVEEGVAPGRWRVRYRVKEQPRISIIVPTNGTTFLPGCIDSVLERTSYPNYEIVIVDNSEQDRDHVLRYWESLRPRSSDVRYLRFSHKPFNYSAINNYAVQQTDASYLLLLNDDTTVVEKGWLEALLEHAQRPEVGAVGAKLLYPDGSIQHAGVILGPGGVAGHAFRRTPPGDAGLFNMVETVRNYSAVTFACVMMRRHLYEELNGLDDTNLAVAFNDVDMCLRLREQGYLVVYTPFAVLYHHESASRPFTLESAEVEYMRQKWGHLIARDPYYNPNLTRTAEDFGLGIDLAERSAPRRE